ncbi:MAG TPA: hypothetical protein VGE34_03225 [Candidatus Saccharimonadales bacterium]
MNTKQFIKATLFGFLIWLVPLIISFGFYDQERRLVIEETSFKSVMVVVLCAVVVLLSVRYFKLLKGDYIRQGLLLGLWWLVINLVLDTILLLPLLKVSFGEYFMQIGLRYLIMPIIAFGTGYLLRKRQ